MGEVKRLAEMEYSTAAIDELAVKLSSAGREVTATATEAMPWMYGTEEEGEESSVPPVYHS